MTAHHNVRTIAGTTTAPKIRRSSGRRSAPRWVGPAGFAAVAVAALVGFNELRSTDDPAPARPVTTAPGINTGFVPLISEEERAIIDGEFPPLARRQVATVTVTEPLIGSEERAIINGEYPRVLAIDLCATQKPC